MLEKLNDETTYQKIVDDPTHIIQEKMINKLRELKDQNEIDTRIKLKFHEYQDNLKYIRMDTP